MNSESPIQFPIAADALVATLVELFRHQGNISVCNLLQNAKSRIDENGYDGWDGGQYYFTLHLNLPLKIFAPIEHDVPKIEKAITSKFSTVLRDTGNLHLRNTAISPILEQPSKAGQSQVAPIHSEHLWEKGILRLFLSHVSAHKVHVAKLKLELRFYGISAFVAHEDIEPNSLWQGEIELALASMDALLALLTPDFHQSNWTDQEVGIALGRNVMVIPVRLGQDPYGFIGKQQGLSASWESHQNLVSEVVELLLKDKRTNAKMKESLVVQLGESRSYVRAIAISKILEGLDYFTPEQLLRLKSACENSRIVRSSFGVPERIDGIIARFNQSTAEGSPL